MMTTEMLSIRGGQFVYLPRLTTLNETKDGDVFYPVSTPWEVWQRRHDAAEYPFMQIGSECDFESVDVGDGEPGQQVVVMHNIRLVVKRFAEGLAAGKGGC